MRQLRRLVLAACCGLLLLVQSAGAGVLLVEKGQPRAVIVVASGASEQAREAARLLQDYLARISGARLEIRDEAAPVAGAQILALVDSLPDGLPEPSRLDLDQNGRTARGEELWARADVHASALRCTPFTTRLVAGS